MGTPSAVCCRRDLISPQAFQQQQNVWCGRRLDLSRNLHHQTSIHFARTLNLRALCLEERRKSCSSFRYLAPPEFWSSRGLGVLPLPRLRRRRTEYLRCRADAGPVPQAASQSSGLKLTRKTVQTDSLPPSVRDSTMRAIDELGRRVTNGDVASRTGLKVSQAESALQALAADSGGFLEVSDAGDVLYVFPKEYRSNLNSKSLKMKIEPALNKLQAAAAYMIRISFGTALVASIVIVYSAILVLLSSSRGDEDSRGNRGGYGNQRYNSGGGGMTFFVSPADLFWFWDPYYNRRPRATGKRGGMNFFESVFSFVFGDGDPNEGLEERRWKVIGDLIASKGGVVTTEELAPYLDVPSLSEDNEKDESFVLPALLRFDGFPEVDSKGNILYKFPSLQRTANIRAGQRKEGSEESVYLAERRWNFSKSSKTDQALVLGLGALNLVGVVVLGGLLRDANIVGQLGGSGLVPFAARILPWLQAYTASFFAIPAFRWLLLQRRNTEIEDRNRARIGWAVALQRANKALLEKLTSAREMAQRTFIGRDQIIYSTEKDFSDQSYEDSEAREWDERFKRSQTGKK